MRLCAFRPIATMDIDVHTVQLCMLLEDTCILSERYIYMYFASFILNAFRAMTSSISYSVPCWVLPSLQHTFIAILIDLHAGHTNTVVLCSYMQLIAMLWVILQLAEYKKYWLKYLAYLHVYVTSTSTLATNKACHASTLYMYNYCTYTYMYILPPHWIPLCMFNCWPPLLPSSSLLEATVSFSSTCKTASP